MLLQNKSFLTCNGLRYLAGSPAVSGVLARPELGGTMSTKSNRYIGQAGMYKGDATPSGYTPTGGAWYPNVKAGGLGCRNLIQGSGAINSASIAGGINGSVSITGYGSIATRPYMQIADHFIIDSVSLTSLGGISNTSNVTGVIPFKSTDPVVITGSGTIPDVLMRILDWYSLNLEGDGSLSGSFDLKTVLSSTLNGSGDITYAALTSLIHLLGNISGNSSITNAALNGLVQLLSDIAGSGDLTYLNLTGLVNLIGDISGSGSISYSELIGLVHLLGDIYGSGVVPDPVMDGLANLIGNMSGSSALNPGLKFPAVLLAELQGEGTLLDSLLKGIAWCVSDILSRGSIDSSLHGDAYMGADITSVGDLVTAQSCAQAVWNAIAAAYNTSGTMGNKMNSASAAGDPWTIELPGTYTDESAGAILSKLEKLNKDIQALVLASL